MGFYIILGRGGVVAWYLPAMSSWERRCLHARSSFGGQVKPFMIEGLEFAVWVGVWDLGLRAQRGFGVLGG